MRATAGKRQMDYSLFKGLFGLLLFGAAFAIGIAQLVSVRRARRSDEDSPD